MGAYNQDSRTTVDRRSDVELVISRRFDAPPRIVFKAWTTPELFVRWWAPKSSGVPILSCEMDVRTGGKYRLVFGQDAASGFAFYGKYLEVAPDARLVWTNDEGEEEAITTVTLEAVGGATQLVLQEVYPTKAALDEAFVGMEDASPEQFAQLDALLAEMA